jgi:hypothetical protein
VEGGLTLRATHCLGACIAALLFGCSSTDATGSTGVGASTAAGTAAANTGGVTAENGGAAMMPAASGGGGAMPAPPASDATDAASAGGCGANDACAPDASEPSGHVEAGHDAGIGAGTDAGNDAGLGGGCSACTQSEDLERCPDDRPVLWECFGPFPSGGLPAALTTECTDLATNVPRYCCPRGLWAECPTG